MRARGANGTTGQVENTNQQLGYNQSHFQQFLILGGEFGLKSVYTELALILLLFYVLIVIGNSMVCIAVVLETKLHTPMYIFLSLLSFSDIVITTSVLPKFMSVCLLNDIAISYSGCFLQLITYLGFQATEGILLAVMAYDRYMAICNPLRYNDIVTPRLVALLVISTCITGILIPLPIVILAGMLPFCGNHIMFWFCDFPPVIALACSDITPLLFLALANAVAIMGITGIIIIYTYSRILLTVLKIKSVDGRNKAFSTCSSHLSIVIMFYAAHYVVYISSTVRNVNPNILIVISIINCLLTPFMNPVIYSLRNKDLKIAMQKHFFSHFTRSPPL